MQNKHGGLSSVFVILFCVFKLVMKGYFTLTTVVLRNLTKRNVCKKKKNLVFIRSFFYSVRHFLSKNTKNSLFPSLLG